MFGRAHSFFFSEATAPSKRTAEAARTTCTAMIGHGISILSGSGTGVVRGCANWIHAMTGMATTKQRMRALGEGKGGEGKGREGRGREGRGREGRGREGKGGEGKGGEGKGGEGKGGFRK